MAVVQHHSDARCDFAPGNAEHIHLADLTKSLGTGDVSDGIVNYRETDIPVSW